MNDYFVFGKRHEINGKEIADADLIGISPRCKGKARAGRGGGVEGKNVKGRPGEPEAALRMVSGRKCRSRSLYRSILKFQR
ncbi:MAG: hypothetical protein KGL48_08830 [Sphingomonadales bacterium]|nr:hypothetical protein [Sphingomonadales bacterium]MDE2568181.1 hypothetical protein [Sphingomonadales bacterium]